ncbi:MAG: hypothetical protein C0617_02755 [Desulfuromonas sp.]|uniref:hypothetical protein n=1 Tax=Desulfuromonas sp. TaxID=892 RepID=UPI000CB05C6A|nr:hypothetical protein [Desulfuromonas sp.]PLX85938.1 MAG: hypothetical protein C0617_02755 [Desulfuromonas sp.]
MGMRTLFMMALAITALVFGSISPASAGEKKIDLALCAPTQVFTIDIDNPYILYSPVGRQWRLVGEEDDEIIIVRITVLDETETLYPGTFNVLTRVVEELEAVDENEDGFIQNDEVIEQSFNYYAQRTADDTLCYFGEEVWEPAEEEVFALFDNGDEPVPGEVVDGLERNEEGEWRADEGMASSPGVFFPASDDALPGTKFQQENGPPDALDEMKIVGSGSVLLEDVTIDGVAMEDVTFEDVRRGREFNPVDGDKGYKTFARGVGIILDEDFQIKETGVLP